MPANTPSPLAFALGLLIAGDSANARADEKSSETEALEPAKIVIQASADASAAGLTRPYAGGQVARGGRVGLLGNQDIMDTPFASTSYTQALIQDQQARSVADVLQNDAAVRTARGFGNFQELYVIRGFPVYSDDIAYNGLYGLLPRQYIAAEFLERVEVFRGANTFLNGAAPGGSGLGGAINLLPKRAPDAALTQLSFGQESGSQKFAAIDLGRRYGDARETGVRFNALRRDGDTAVDGEARKLTVLALGLDHRIGNLRLSADIGHQDHRLSAPRPSVTPSNGIPVAPDADSNFAQPWTYSKERQSFGTLRAEYDLAPSLTLWAAAGARRGREEAVLSNPTATADGKTTSYRFDNVREDRVATGEIGLRKTLQTGAVTHQISAVASRHRIDSRNAYAFSSFSGFAGSLYSASAVAAPAADFYVGGSLADPRSTQKTSTASFALADSLSAFDDRLKITVGARQQRIEDHTYDYNTGSELSQYAESRITPVAGILFKLNRAVSLYASYIEGLARGDVAPATSGGVKITNAGEAFAPYASRQKEVGIKLDTGRFGGSLSAYTTSKPSGYVVGDQFAIAGEQRNRGLELALFGEPLAGVRVLGGATLTDAKLRHTANGADDGHDAIGVPGLQTNLGVEWALAAVKGLSLEARAVHTSSQYADAANTMELPSWTRFDVGARYVVDVGAQLLTLRARVDNLTNRSYWASAGGYPGSGYLVLGAPRSVSLSASVDF
jgi:iron complex outermembrane receptor protein